jgi:hypothetical protein
LRSVDGGIVLEAQRSERDSPGLAYADSVIAAGIPKPIPITHPFSPSE